MKRRGYIISACILGLDLLLFAYGGGIVAVAAIIYVLGLGEWSAKVKCRAIECNPTVGIRHNKLSKSFLQVKQKVEIKGDYIPSAIRVYLVPGAEMNAYCFGARSIGVTEGLLNLDAATVEAVIAHEMGHLIAGDSILNMVLFVNCLGILALLAFYQFAVIAAVYIIFLICGFIGVFHFSFISYFITNKISGLFKAIIEAAKAVVIQSSRLLIAGLGRASEFEADGYAASLGYSFYLKHFLDRFAQDTAVSEQSLFEVLYNTHPSTAARIQHLVELESI